MKNVIIRMIGLYLNVLAIISPRAAGLRGFMLFCRPMRVPLTRKQKEFFNTGEKFAIDHDGVKVQGYRWGNGPKKVVFFHGWQSHSYRWKHYVEKLSGDHYTVYVIDAPGHGTSGGDFLSVPVYSDVMHQFLISLGDVHAVVGHSLGGFSLLYTFYRFPLLPVNRMVLLAAPGEATDFIEVFKNTLKLQNRTVERVMDQFVTRYDVAPDFFSAIEFAKSVKVPGLIIHDETDQEAPFRYASLIHKAWKRSQLLTTQGFGHNLRSTVVVDHVVDFLDAEATVVHTEDLKNQVTIL